MISYIFSTMGKATFLSSIRAKCIDPSEWANWIAGWWQVSATFLHLFPLCSTLELLQYNIGLLIGLLIFK